MAETSNNYGRAYEYICLLTLCEKIGQRRACTIEKNSSFLAAEKSWTSLDDNIKKNLKISSDSIIDTMFELEPLILEDDGDFVMLSLQKDTEGESGDVRDIIVRRPNIEWEIGLSLKHNHFAVKHSRLSGSIDFGKKWFGFPCSKSYWDEVSDVFECLRSLQSREIEWGELENKQDDIYVPILEAFKEEIIKSSSIDKSIPQKMVEYLLGEYDFYKIISVDPKRLTQIEAFNLHGELNKDSKKESPKKVVPRTYLPTRIVSFDFKPNSKTTLELYMDNGWQFTFRIHNASTIVEPSLKFDIQIIGMPTTILTIYCLWESQ